MSRESVRVFALEDDFFHQENLRITLEDLGYDLVGLEDKAEGMLPVVKEKKPDIVLLDIHLSGEESGIDLGHKINQQLPTPIIYITSFSDSQTFKKASLTHPYAYLTKPVEKLALQSSIELALQSTDDEAKESQEWESDILFRNFFFVKIGPKLVKIHPEEVLYIEVDGNRYCKIVTLERQAHIRGTLPEIQRKLNPSPYIRVHKSFLINPLHLESIHQLNQTLQIGPHEIPLGKTYKESFYDRLNRL